MLRIIDYRLRIITIGILVPVFLSMLTPPVSWAESRGTAKAFVITTTDPYFTTDSNTIDKQWYLQKTKIPQAWEYTEGSSSVIVAVIDTGIHASHVELNDGRVIAGYNAITGKDIPANSDSDDNGHGTAVAGVIGAIPNNNKGIAGVNWNIKLMPIKALASDGSGDLVDVSKGIVWAADHGANIINLSLGGSGFPASQILSNAITYAYNLGVLIVAAAGNDLADRGSNLDSAPVYPICADNGQNMVLGVAATDVNDQKVDFSNFGFNCVDISAPGKRILTTAFLPSNPSENVLVYGSGTSMATPIVSGIAALLKSTNVNLSNVDLRNVLLKTADNIDAFNQTACLGGSCNGFLGKGRVNALTAIAPHPITEGSLVRETATGNIYSIRNNAKRLVSTFVFNQRGFDPANVTNEVSGQLASFPTSNPVPPLEGTLIKSVNDPEVFIINQELKRPLTYLVFVSRGLNFADVKTLPDLDVVGFRLGEWYWPPDATMVLVAGNPLVYVMDAQVRRPVTYFVFTQRHLSFAKVIKVTADEFSHVPSPADQYWLPPIDGSLIKSDIDPGIYVIENGARRLLSYDSFVARGYKFNAVKTLPQVEIDVIAPGLPIL